MEAFMTDPYAAPVIERPWDDAGLYIECGMLVVKSACGVPVAKISESKLVEKLAEMQAQRKGI